VRKVKDAWWESLPFSQAKRLLIFKTSKQWSFIGSHTNFISPFRFVSVSFSFSTEIAFTFSSVTYDNFSGMSRKFLSFDGGLNSNHLPSSRCIDKNLDFDLVPFLQIPSCLILQMPRFGSRYKMYDMILPNLELNISLIVENGTCQDNKWGASDWTTSTRLSTRIAC